MNDTNRLFGQCCTSENGGQDSKQIVLLIWHVDLICERVVIHLAKRSTSEELVDGWCSDVYRINSPLPCCDVDCPSRWKRDILGAAWNRNFAKLLFRQAIEDCQCVLSRYQ